MGRQQHRLIFIFVYFAFEFYTEFHVDSNWASNVLTKHGHRHS